MNAFGSFLKYVQLYGLWCRIANRPSCQLFPSVGSPAAYMAAKNKHLSCTSITLNVIQFGFKHTTQWRCSHVPVSKFVGGQRKA